MGVGRCRTATSTTRTGQKLASTHHRLRGCPSLPQTESQSGTPDRLAAPSRDRASLQDRKLATSSRLAACMGNNHSACTCGQQTAHPISLCLNFTSQTEATSARQKVSQVSFQVDIRCFKQCRCSPGYLGALSISFSLVLEPLPRTES